MLVYCWSTVYDAGPTVIQHRGKVSSFELEAGRKRVQHPNKTQHIELALISY